MFISSLFSCTDKAFACTAALDRARGGETYARWLAASVGQVMHAEDFRRMDDARGGLLPERQCKMSASGIQTKRAAGFKRAAGRCAAVQMKTEKENTGEHPSSGISYYAREGFLCHR